MICYASRTGTKRNLSELRTHGWRLLVSAAVVQRSEGFKYALDNGAWTAYSSGQPFNVALFTSALRKLGGRADWAVIPDALLDHRVLNDVNGLDNPTTEILAKWIMTTLGESIPMLESVVVYESSTTWCEATR